jgi:hypothetical protein
MTSRNLREEEYLAVATDGLEESVLEDLAVDGHGHALLEMAPERRVEFGELLVELLYGRRRELELGDAPRELREVADQDYAGHLTWGPRHGPHTPNFVAPRETRGAPR